MTYFHVFWTRPQLDPTRPAEAQDLELWDFEALTWLLSALEIRRHAALRLVTDCRGLSFVRKAGLDWLYTGGISTELDAIPPHLDAAIFWAAGKLHAQRLVKPPSVCLDTDLVLWAPLKPTTAVTALHVEDNQWAWYRAGEADFKRHGFTDPGWNWNLHPVNTAVLHFADAELARFYAETAIRFMEDYSRAAATEAIPDAADSPARVDPMIFAEQRLLPMCAERLGRTLGLLRPGPAPGGYLRHGPDCFHLWTAKPAYKQCPDARIALVNSLIAQVHERFPEARETLVRWKLDAAKAVGRDDDAGGTLAQAGAGGFKFSLLREVRGLVSIEDPVSGVVRRAAEGGLVWSAEIVRPEAGASFELGVVGGEGLTIRQGS